jgi:uncharacterized protein (UPF0264 family)
MPQLLVSVRNSTEALLAAYSGAEIIDLKEPAAGALGSVSLDVRKEVVRQLKAHFHEESCPPLSAALGELSDYQTQPEKAAELSQLQAFRFAKVGLAATRQLTDWRKAWLDLVQTLPPGTIPVAAAYADAEQADSPAPEDVLDLALDHSLPVFLLDTWCKTQGNVFQVLSEPRLERLRAQAQGRIRFALAGSLTLDCLPQLLQLQPDIVALRGAVCMAGRKSPLSGDKVRHWKSMVSLLTDSKSLV